jgi:hypothetical protein
VRSLRGIGPLCIDGRNTRFERTGVRSSVYIET